MRLFVLTALASFATPALACGMYIPEDMMIASIGELMIEVDAEPVDDGTITDPTLVAEVTASQPAVVSTGLQQALVPQQAVEIEPPVKLTRKERRQLKRLARTAGV